jgi:transcriptional regulator with XRE-family HTH domain
MPRPKAPEPSNKIRLHYIPEWAERRGLIQADMAEALDVDKGTVSRWFAGGLPSEAMIPRIAAMFGIELAELFREPGDDWMARFFRKRTTDEMTRIKQILLASFPEKKDGTNG